MGFLVCRTAGFMGLDEATQLKVMRVASIVFATSVKTNGKPDLIVFYPCEPGFKPHFDDDGRTLVACLEGLGRKVYAFLSDLGDPENWGRLYDPETVKELEETVNQRYVITLMLADEY
jgi:hypothetical protein